jgi:nucleotide-binding universal stress UspA family protein
MVPVDFSDTSKNAVIYGLSLALEFDAKLILVHIAPFEAQAYEQAKIELLALIPNEYRERLNFEIVVKAGPVRPEILAIANGGEVDLVIMGTHGRPYFERMLVGSVTERMLRKVNVPILTVSHMNPDREQHRRAPVPLQGILYATDLVAGCENGLEFSFRLARGLGAKLTVAHILHTSDSRFQGVEGAAYLPGYAGDLRACAGQRLADKIVRYSTRDVPVTTILADGVPYEEINRLAQEYSVDLIVINLQSKGRLERALLGATAERVIRTATVPVLSLPLSATYAFRWAAA